MTRRVPLANPLGMGGTGESSTPGATGKPPRNGWHWRKFDGDELEARWIGRRTFSQCEPQNGLPIRGGQQGTGGAVGVDGFFRRPCTKGSRLSCVVSDSARLPVRNDVRLRNRLNDCGNVTKPCHLAAAVSIGSNSPSAFHLSVANWKTSLHFARAGVRRLHLAAPQNSLRRTPPVAHPPASGTRRSVMVELLLGSVRICQRFKQRVFFGAKRAQYFGDLAGKAKHEDSPVRKNHNLRHRRFVSWFHCTLYHSKDQIESLRHGF